MKITLNIWRQPNPTSNGAMQKYDLDGVSEDMSFLEMLDLLNENLNEQGEDPVAFDSDCREGICGTCSLMINGVAHGPEVTTTCQLHMRSFKDGDTITVEPWRADPFPVLKDLIVDRSAFDRIIQSGGYISVNTGSAPEANNLPVEKAKRPGLRHGDLHRLRRLRGGLPERLCVAVPRREDHSPRRAPPGPAGARHPRGRHGRPARPRASAAAPTSVSAVPPAPRRSRST